jgi:TRAP-type C4-dicarboxylate transport system permease large subunit
MGMILDSTSILLIMVPIGAPIAQAMGFDLIHFGIITIIADPLLYIEIIIGLFLH